MTTLYRFDTFTLDPLRKTLRSGDGEVPLPESAWLVLEALVTNAPDMVDKETLINAGWPDAAVVQDNLVQAIHTIRSTLGGDARNPRFVQTVHRRGYRFVAEVERIDIGHEQPVSNGEDPPESRLKRSFAGRPESRGLSWPWW